MSLEKDLGNRIGERLKLWIKDSQELFAMARLEEDDAARAIIAELTCALAYTVAKWIDQKDDLQIAESVYSYIKQCREAIAQKEMRK